MGIPSAAATAANVSRSSKSILPQLGLEASGYTARRHRPVTRRGQCQTLVRTDMHSFDVAGRDCTAQATGPVRPPAQAAASELRRRRDADQHQHLAVANMNLGSGTE